jgi:hypothetical protein
MVISEIASSDTASPPPDRAERRTARNPGWNGMLQGTDRPELALRCFAHQDGNPRARNIAPMWRFVFHDPF